MPKPEGDGWLIFKTKQKVASVLRLKIPFGYLISISRLNISSAD